MVRKSVVSHDQNVPGYALRRSWICEVHSFLRERIKLLIRKSKGRVHFSRDTKTNNSNKNKNSEGERCVFAPFTSL